MSLCGSRTDWGARASGCPLLRPLSGSLRTPSPPGQGPGLCLRLRHPHPSPLPRACLTLRPRPGRSEALNGPWGCPPVLAPARPGWPSPRTCSVPRAACSVALRCRLHVGRLQLRAGQLTPCDSVGTGAGGREGGAAVCLVCDCSGETPDSATVPPEQSKRVVWVPDPPWGHLVCFLVGDTGAWDALKSMTEPPRTAGHPPGPASQKSGPRAVQGPDRRPV